MTWGVPLLVHYHFAFSYCSWGSQGQNTEVAGHSLLQWTTFCQSTKRRPGAYCGSDHELLIAKFRLKLRKVGKIARPFRYDRNQNPYDNTVEVTNRLKGLDLKTECLKNYGWRFVTLYRRQRAKISPRTENAKRQNACLRRT